MIEFAALLAQLADAVEIISKVPGAVEFFAPSKRSATEVAEVLRDFSMPAGRDDSVLEILVRGETALLKSSIDDYVRVSNDRGYDAIEIDKYRSRVRARGCATLTSLTAVADQIPDFATLKQFFCQK